MRLPVALATVAVLAVAAGLRAQPLPTAAALDSLIAQRMDSLIAQRMDSVGIMGVAAAVLVDREVVWMQGYGFADYERTRPFTPQTVMNVASIAKPFTGVALMQAVQAGRLQLDADVNTHLPFRVVNPHHPDAPITLRHLATHTSGITDRWAVYRTAYRFGGAPPVPLDRFLADYLTPGGATYAPENFLDARPGALREYANIGAALAGYIVERAVGEPLPAYTRRHIFRPLGMTNTAWSASEAAPGAHSTLFIAQDGEPIPIQPFEMTTYPDGGVHTSVADLSRFFSALLSGGTYGGVRILDPAMAAEMTRFQFTDANRPENFPAEDGNSGLFWRTKFNGTRVGHGGNDPGVSAEMLASLDGRTGVILFMNTSVAGADRRAANDVFDALWAYAASLQAGGR